MKICPDQRACQSTGLPKPTVLDWDRTVQNFVKKHTLPMEHRTRESLIESVKKLEIQKLMMEKSINKERQKARELELVLEEVREQASDVHEDWIRIRNQNMGKMLSLIDCEEETPERSSERESFNLYKELLALDNRHLDAFGQTLIEEEVEEEFREGEINIPEEVRKLLVKQKLLVLFFKMKQKELQSYQKSDYDINALIEKLTNVRRYTQKNIRKLRKDCLSIQEEVSILNRENEEVHKVNVQVQLKNNFELKRVMNERRYTK